jgi:hypothetical protein
MSSQSDEKRVFVPLFPFFFQNSTVKKSQFLQLVLAKVAIFHKVIVVKALKSLRYSCCESSKFTI